MLTHYTIGRKEAGNAEERAVDFWPWLLSSHYYVVSHCGF